MWRTVENIDRGCETRMVFAWVIVLFFFTTGCGASNPEEAQGTGPGQMVSVSVPDINFYLSDVRRTYFTVNLMTAEFGSISQSWSFGFVSDYWTHQFLNNLRLRLEILEVQVEGIRPVDAQLRDIHTEYENALVNFEEAFDAFDSQIDISTDVGLEQVNLLLLAGNLDLDRFQLRLSNLSGQQITF